MEEKEVPKRKPTRLKSFDYSTNAAYFITICTKDRRQILSKIVGGDVLDAPKNVELFTYGKIVDKYLNQIGNFYDNISIDRYVIMPNHIHFMLLVYENGASRTSPPTRQHSLVSSFVSTFKRFCNKEIGVNIWQRHFYDHIIRNKDDYIEHIKYIEQNPKKWIFDELYVEN